MKKILVVILISFCSFYTLNAQTIAPFKDGDRIGFLGNSITDGGHYHSYIWLYYMTRFPDMKLNFLNVGIGGDRAIDMVKRFDGDVLSKDLSVLITTFGMNDSGYFEYNGDQPEAFADQKVSESFDAYKQLETKFKTFEDTRIVLMGSSPYDEKALIEGNTPFKNKNKAMLRIVDFQRKSAESNGWEFFDLNQPMTEINTKYQQIDPSFTICGNDRIHPDNDGHMIMAYLFLKEQGFSGKCVSTISVDASKMNITSSENCEISNLKKNSKSLSFDYLAHSLPYAMDTIARGWGNKKSQAEAVKIVPFIEEMNKEILIIKGLSGNYRLTIDEEVIGNWSAKELAEGINLATLTNTPQYQQALKVMFLNEERWEIERRFREYAWVEFNFFLSKGVTNLNSRKAIEILDKYKDSDGWLKGRRDLFSKAMFPEVRESWQKQMDLLISTIYEVNKPISRKITLTPSK